MLLDSSIALQISIVIIVRKLIDQTRTTGVLKGISLALAIFDKRFWIRISFLSKVSATRLCIGFCRSLKGRL